MMRQAIFLIALNLFSNSVLAQQDATPPAISLLTPSEGEVIPPLAVPFSFLFDATVTDESELRDVKFMVRDPSGNRSPWVTGNLREGSSDIYEASLELPQGGTWSYRVRAVDNSPNRNSMTTPWYNFHVAGSPANSIAIVKQEIADIIASRTDINLAAKFVRLGFHDCVPDEELGGGCDGCVDLSNGENAGLDVPIDALTPIVDQYATPAYGLSRADIWAMAALVGSEVSQNDITFPFEYIGRVDCENAHDVCYKENGSPQPCQENRGPHRPLPGPDLTTSELLHWFSLRFDFNSRETTAIMGAHSIGGAHRENSGFDGEHGWVNNPNQLANGYYNMICAPPTREGAISAFEAAMFAPAWDLEFIDNTQIGKSSRYQWFHQKDANRDDAADINLDKLVMLNSDIALVRDLDGYLNPETGEVTGCQFRCLNNACAGSATPRCPHAAQTFDIVVEFEGDNLVWLDEFSAAFRKMLIRGYEAEVGVSCSELTPCVLTPLTSEAEFFERKKNLRK
mmetsp:Transcript_30388/g.45995  ORF Transcript_30388/g.45995 Transcript_30388/m.45995 type:complete len:511 (-) Transcript_30388:384-1916(-)